MKKFSLLVISFLALTITLNSCGNSSKKEATAEVKPKVKVAQVFERGVTQTQTFTASVEPDVKNSIAPQQPGRIRKIMVDIGSYVAKGQKVVQMDQVNLSNSQAQIDNLRRNYNRTKELQAVGGASQMDVDNLKVQLDQLEGNIKQLNENTYLTSPVSGIVAAKNYDDGDLYTGQLPVLTVMKISPVKVKVNVSESFYSKVKIGMPADITIDVFPGENFSGKVSLIYPTIDEQTRTFTIEIIMPNANRRIRPGMFARVTMNFGTVNHVVVPDLAVIKQVGSGARFVYVYSDGKVSYNEVKLGQRIGSEYELLSGVPSGAEVVIAGQNNIIDGASVTLLK